MNQSIKPSNSATLEFLKTVQRQLLINNEWVNGRSGEMIATIDPATGETLAEIVSAQGADVDDAVSAARAALTSAEWAGMTPSARGQLLWKLGDLIEQNIDELAELGQTPFCWSLGRDTGRG